MRATAGPALHTSWGRGKAESRPQEHTVLLPWKDPLENHRITGVGFQPGFGPPKRGSVGRWGS